MKFDDAFDQLMVFEGGEKVTRIPGDSGGVTKWGISSKAFPELDIAKLTREDAKHIYKESYWNPCKCGMGLNPVIEYIMFDTAVNMGVGTAIRMLQEAAGVIEDGVLGPFTISKSTRVDKERFALYRMYRYAGIVSKNPVQAKFLAGWASRVKQIVDNPKL